MTELETGLPDRHMPSNLFNREGTRVVLVYSLSTETYVGGLSVVSGLPVDGVGRAGGSYETTTPRGV